MRRGDYRNYYKGHMDKIKVEGGGGGGSGFSWGGEKVQTTVTEQQYKIKIKKSEFLVGNTYLHLIYLPTLKISVL